MLNLVLFVVSIIIAITIDTRNQSVSTNFVRRQKWTLSINQHFRKQIDGIRFGGG